MKYLMFGGETYYAKGGFNDLIGLGDSVDGLIYSDGVSDLDWWHVVDTETNEIVAGTESQAHGANDIPVEIQEY
jgi:hypothetical protein